MNLAKLARASLDLLNRVQKPEGAPARSALSLFPKMQHLRVLGYHFAQLAAPSGNSAQLPGHCGLQRRLRYYPRARQDDRPQEAISGATSPP
eukprot:1864546-Alexandrium_andersonii.AAC.1